MEKNLTKWAKFEEYVTKSIGKLLISLKASKILNFVSLTP